jgi:predicted alpha/beta superfamily hydrolase
MRKTALAVACTAVVTAAVTFAVSRHLFERPEVAENVIAGSLHSAVLGEDRGLLVHLPESWERSSARRYPVLYVLDGSSQDLHTAASAALMARIGVMPEVLVVGVPNVSGEGRQRDYTPPGMRQDIDEPDSPEGRGDRFLEFLATELMPRVDRDFPAAGPRLLAGHSRGALLVVYSLIAAPSLFDARFAHSPALWRDDGAIVARMESFLASSPGVSGSLYLSLGERENEKMTRAFERLVALLQAKAPASLRWRADLTRGADHGGNAQRATPVGLMFHFGGVAGSPRDDRPPRATGGTAVVSPVPHA